MRFGFAISLLVERAGNDDYDCLQFCNSLSLEYLGVHSMEIGHLLEKTEHRKVTIVNERISTGLVHDQIKIHVKCIMGKKQ